MRYVLLFAARLSTALFAARTARPLSRVRPKTEDATFAQSVFSGLVAAFFVKRAAVLGL
jgi:hypothetical protein